MNIFGWKSAGRGLLRPAKARVQQDRLSGIRNWGAASLGEWPRNYEAQVREGYLHNAIAQRAVRLVADGLASAPLTSNDPEALALVKATSGGQALIETVAAHVLLHGNAYVEILSGPDGRPAELFALRPERVSVEADMRGWPVAYVYKAGEVATRLPADGIIHIRSMHPLDDHYGLVVWARRRGRWRSTMPRRDGTRLCSTMRRGLRGLWCTRRARAAPCRASNMGG